MANQKKESIIQAHTSDIHNVHEFNFLSWEMLGLTGEFCLQQHILMSNVNSIIPTEKQILHE